MTVDPPYELEIKLALPGASAWRAVRDRLRVPVVAQQANHFFDTADRALDRARIGVRLRVTGDTTRLTVKAEAETTDPHGLGEPDPLEAPLTRRVELEAMIDRRAFDQAIGQSLDLEPWLTRWRRETDGGDPAVGRVLDALAAAGPLRRFGSFTNERTTGRLVLPAGGADGAPVDTIEAAGGVEVEVVEVDVEAELDRTTFPGDHVEYELEIELDATTPRDEARAIERSVRESLASIGIEAGTAVSKLARFRARLDRTLA